MRAVLAERPMPASLLRPCRRRETTPSVDSICLEKTRRANAARPFRRNRSMSKIVCLPSHSGGAPSDSSIASKARAVAFASAAIVLAVPLLSRLQRLGRRARRAAAGAAGERRPGGAAHASLDSEEFSGRLEADRVRRAPAARLGHDRQDPFHRRRLRAEGRAAVHDRPAPVRGRGGAGAVAARRHQGPRRAGAERARARPEACSIRRRSRARSSTS